tara:strand:- start:298 stop:687 length:390 start_codon:yes stop_codon:yes gene_type:complete
LEEIGSLTVEAFKNNIDNAEDWANAISSEWVAKKAKGGFETDILKMTLKLRESINHRVVSSKGIKELKYTWSRKASNGKLKGTDISDFIIAARDFTFIPKDLLQGGATYEQVWGKHMQRLRDDIIAMAK